MKSMFMFHAEKLLLRAFNNVDHSLMAPADFYENDANQDVTATATE
jgi:hypothetical protein